MAIIKFVTKFCQFYNKMVVDTHFHDTFRASLIQPSSTSLWAQFMYYILFILLSMARAHATYLGKLRKCDLKGISRFLLDLLHEPSTCVLSSGQGTLIAPQVHRDGLELKISISKQLLCSCWLWPKVFVWTLFSF